LKRTLALRRATWGDSDLGIPTNMTSLAWALSRVGRHDEARQMAEEAVERYTALYGRDHLWTLIGMNNLALVLGAAGKHAEATTLDEEILRRRKAVLGPNDPNTLLSMNNLAVDYQRAGRLKEAILLLEDAVPRMKKQNTHSPNTLLSIFNLATLYRDAGRHADAAPLFEEAVRGAENVLGSDHPDTQARINRAAESLPMGGRWAEAAVMREKQLAHRRRKLPPDHVDLVDPLGELGACRIMTGEPAAAEVAYRECQRIQVKFFPDDWRRFNGMSLLGHSVLDQKKYAEAEPLLVQGYEGMKAREAHMADHDKVCLTRAINRLVRLYEATNQPDKAAAWRAKLDDAKGAGKK
jgi:tetratricopeptide (TPR) repeat protein